MKKRIQPLVLISIALCGVSAAFDEEFKRGVSRDGIETCFDPHAVLTETQIAIVVDLVRQCGMKSVRRIRTYNCGAQVGGTEYDIRVGSDADTNGREMKYSSVSVSYEKWNPGGRKSRKSLKSSGDFWVEDKVDVNRFAIFAAHCGPIRVHLDDSIPLSIADKVVAAMDSGKLHWKDASLKVRFDERVNEAGIVTSRPAAISLDEDGKCIIELPRVSDDHGMSLVCTLDADGELTAADFSELFI